MDIYLPIAEMSVHWLVVLGMGFVTGIPATVMWVGEAFLMVPVMIYTLHMPSHVAVGTSMFQVMFVTTAAVLHALKSHLVDIVLASVLIAGGVFGVQYGVRVGGKLRGEQLRFFLALPVLAVAERLLPQMIARPRDIYSIAVGTP